MLDIIYEDEYLVAVNKPYGWVVHWSELIPEDEEKVVLQRLREQLGKNVYTVHRLDRKTTGVLIFALSKVIQRELNKGFEEKRYKKIYWALVRGQVPVEGEITSYLKNLKGKEQLAITRYQRLSYNTITPESYPKFPNLNYSLVELYPLTGRMHQLRKHMTDIFHPIVGDRAHGNKAQDTFFTEQFDYTQMALHSKSICIRHPFTGLDITIHAPLRDEFKRLIRICGIRLNGIKEL
jgi:tRNA pseudouridine65 synthase